MDSIIITGASSGIGAALAVVFSKAGYNLGLIARNSHAMHQLNLPNTICESADVTNYFALENTIHIIKNKLGPISCLINNAGYAKGGEFCDIAQIDDMNTVNVNVLGLINATKLILPDMRKQQGGTIINISSVADRKPRPNLATYAATKAAVKSLSESLRVANAKYGIRVCNIAPGKINTPMLIAGELGTEDAINAEEFAKMVLWVYQQPPKICIRDLEVAPTAYET